MNSSKQHIDIELLKRYYNSELTDIEQNELEKQALDDPFLKDAMDGFDENPESFTLFYNRHQAKLKNKKSYTLIFAIGGLALLFVLTTFFNRNKTLFDENDTNPLAQVDSFVNQDNITIIEEDEVEIIPTAIETLTFIPSTELITVADVVADQRKIDLIHTTEDLPIEINEDLIPEDDFAIEDDNHHKIGKNGTPFTYLYDLTVVDYRSIQRDKKSISYSRYVLGGTSANKENETTPNILTETEVKIPYFDYLDKSMSFFANKNFKKALNRYLVILEQYPKDQNALFYGGLAYYNLGEYTKSIVFFNRNIENNISVFNEEALWYKAKSLIQLHKQKEAISVLDRIIMTGSFYTKEAISLRKTL